MTFRSGVLTGIILGAALGGGAMALARRTPPAVPAPAPTPETPLLIATLRDENDRLKKRVAELEKAPAATTGADLKVESAPSAPAPDLQALFAKLAEGGFAAIYDGEKTKQLLDAVKKTGKEGIDFLTGLLRNSKSATERFLAAALLEGTKDPSAIPALAESLKQDKDAVVRRMSSHALAVLENADAEGPLRTAMTGDSDWGVRANSAYGVAKLGKEDGLRLLRETYESPTTPAEYRLPVLMGLADVAAPSTAPLFRKILGDSQDEGYLLIAIGALEKMKDVESIPALQRVVAGDHPETIQQAAEKAIEALRK